MNELLLLLPEFLRIVGAALSTGAFGKPAALTLLSETTTLAADLIERGEEGSQALKALTDHLTQLVADNAQRSPESWAQAVPAGDWAQLQALHESAKAVIAAYDPQRPVPPIAAPGGPESATDPGATPADPGAAGVPVALAIQTEPDPNVSPEGELPPGGA